MNDLNETEVTDFNPNDKLPKDMTMPELRRTAKAMGINASRDWDQTDFVMAIEARQKGGAFVNVVHDKNQPPKPGYSRIKLQNTQAGENLPVPVSVNGVKGYYRIPRDTEVDIPHEIVEALSNSTYPVWKTETNYETGATKKVCSREPAYPFQLIAATPGVATRPNGQPVIRGSSNPDRHRLREKYREINGRWPKRHELAEFIKIRDRHRAGIAVALTPEEEAKMLASKIME